MIVEQIIQFLAIDLKIRYWEAKYSSLLLMHNLSPFKQIMDSFFLHSFHSICFSWPCLPICKTGYNASIEQKVKLWLNRAFVERICRFMLAKGVIQLESLVFDVLGHSVDFEPTVMHDNNWVRTRYNVKFSILKLFGEHRPLPNANIDSVVSRSLMLFHIHNFPLCPLDHYLEIYIALNSVSFVLFFLGQFFLFLSFHLFSPLLSIVSQPKGVNHVWAYC